MSELTQEQRSILGLVRDYASYLFGDQTEVVFSERCPGCGTVTTVTIIRHIAE